MHELCGAYTTTIRLLFDGRSTGVRLLINDHYKVKVTSRYSRSHADLFIYLGRSATTQNNR